jgi:tetratricopeptide (TPR) repeat protein
MDAQKVEVQAGRDYQRHGSASRGAGGMTSGPAAGPIRSGGGMQQPTEDHREIGAAFEQVLEAAPTDALTRLREVVNRIPTPGPDGDRMLAALLERPSMVPHLVQLVLEQDRVEEALTWTARLLGHAPDDRGALMFKSLLEAGRGNDRAAIDASDDLVAAHPGDPDAYLQRGTVRLATMAVAGGGDTTATVEPSVPRLALHDYDTAIQLAPERAEAYLARGQALTELGDLDGALAAYDEGLRRDPALVGGYVDRALLRLRRGLYQQAIQDAGIAIARLAEAKADDRPVLAEAHLNRARALSELGDLDGAADDYSEAVRLNSELLPAWLELGLLHNERREYFEAKQAFDRVIDLDRHNVPAHVGMGDSLLALGHARMASSLYGWAIDYDPDNGPAHLGRARAKLSMGHRARWQRDFAELHESYRQAVEHGERAVALDPGDPWTHADAGRALRAVVAYDQAVSRFDEACRLATRDASALAVLLGEKAEALRLWGSLAVEPELLRGGLDVLEQAAQLDPAPGDEAWIHRIRGATLADLRAYEGALDAFDLAASIDPRSGWAHFGKGRVLLLLDRPQEAAAAFEQMLILDVDDSPNGLWAGAGQLLAQQPWLSTGRSDPDAVPRLGAYRLGLSKGYLERADALAALGADRLAEQDRVTALDLEPESDDAARALAQSYLRREHPGPPQERSGRLLRALDLGRRALDVAAEPSRASCLEVIGQAYLELGDTAEAARHLRAALALEGGRNLWLRLLLDRLSSEPV